MKWLNKIICAIFGHSEAYEHTVRPRYKTIRTKAGRKPYFVHGMYPVCTRCGKKLGDFHSIRRV